MEPRHGADRRHGDLLGRLSIALARCHSDLADPASEDPVARESTGLACAAVNQAMTSVDPRFMRDLMPGSDVPGRFLKQFYGLEAADLDRLPPETCRMMEELSPINHVRRGIPPTLLRYDDPLDAPYGIHHPSFGVALKERIEAVWGRCDLVARRRPVADSRARSIPAFLLDELKGPASG